MAASGHQPPRGGAERLGKRFATQKACLRLSLLKRLKSAPHPGLCKFTALSALGNQL